MKRWTLAATGVAVVFFVLATRRDVYELTSPPQFGWHVLARKTYSIVAFAILGAAIRRALAEWSATRGASARRVPWTCVLAVAGYSAVIEYVQWAGGSHEGLGWNAVDVICGALGGALACADIVARRRRTAEPQP